MSNRTNLTNHPEERRIKLKIITDTGFKMMFAAQPNITIEQLSQEIASVLKQFADDKTSTFYNKTSRIVSVIQLSKDGFYLRQNDLVRDILLDHDDVHCKVETEHTKTDKKRQKVENKETDKQQRVTKGKNDSTKQVKEAKPNNKKQSGSDSQEVALQEQTKPKTTKENRASKQHKDNKTSRQSNQKPKYIDKSTPPVLHIDLSDIDPELKKHKYK